MSSGWFTAFEPTWTTVWLTWVRSDSTPLKQLEPPWTDVLPLQTSSNHCLNEETGFYRVVWHEFGVVQPLCTSLNHCIWLMEPGVQGKTTLYTQFPQSNGGSSRFERVQAPRTNVKLPQTYDKLACTPHSFSQMMVEQVRTGWTTPNSCQTMLYIQFHQSNGGLSWFEGVEPPRTHVKLRCTSSSTSQTLVQEGSKWFNHPKLMSNYPTPGSLSQTVVGSSWFERVEPPRTCFMCTLLS